MTNEDFEQKIRKQLSDTFNDGLTAFERYMDNRSVYDMCVRQHLEKAKKLSLMNTDLELLCKSIGLDYKTVVDEEYYNFMVKISSSKNDR